MKMAKAFTAGIAAMSLLAASGAAIAGAKPAPQAANSASKLSLAGSPAVAAARAANLKRKNASEFAHLPIWFIFAGIGAGVGIAAAAGAFNNGPKSP